MTAQPALLVQLGLGRTGQALVRHVLAQAGRSPQLHYLGLADRAGLWLAPDAWPAPVLEEALGIKHYGMPITRWRPQVFGAEVVPGREAYAPGLVWRLDELGIRRAIVVDVSAPGSGTAPLLAALRRAGYDVVLGNRAPLAGSLAAYDTLSAPARGRLRWEGALCAALRRAVRSGPCIRELTLAGSAALGSILAAVAAGRRFSAAVGEAVARGLLRADPREDLSGAETGRTALALTRALGWRLEPAALQVTSLLPPAFAGYAMSEFWARLPDLDGEFAQSAWLAGERGQVLRYVARAGPAGGTVRLESVDANSDLGRLRAPDSLVTLATGEAAERPLLFQGPGNTPAWTAATVFADITSLLGAGSSHSP